MKKTKEIVSVSLNQYERKKYNPFKLKDFKNERLLKKSLLLGKKKIDINFFKELKISEFDYEEDKKNQIY